MDDMGYTSRAYKFPVHTYRMGDGTICVLQYYDYGYDDGDCILNAIVERRIGRKHVRYQCGIVIEDDVDMADLWRQRAVCKLLACIIVEMSSPFFAEENGKEVEL